MVLCSLSYGGVTFIYDGSPYQPDPMILFRLASKLGYEEDPYNHLEITLTHF